jgi:hypothetical protein
VDRKALPKPDFLSAMRLARPARTVREQALCRLFAEALGVPMVGIDDNFFEVGGDSLMATRLVRRIRDELGLPVTSHVFFVAPTVAGLSERLGVPDS